MTKTKFTPAPWDWQIRHDGRYEIFCNSLNMKICREYTSISQNRNLHDAPLIAAAPELYEALRQIEENCPCSKAKKIAELAMAKARGE